MVLTRRPLPRLAMRSPEILTHETGHVLANLGDEYTNANPGFPLPAPRSRTRRSKPTRLLIKWNAWISTNTPIPTPPTSDYSSVVGLFQGAHYHPTNWYRPELDCVMSHLYVPFCERLQRSPGAGDLPAGAAGGRLLARQHQSFRFDHPSPDLQPDPAPTGHAQSECPMVHQWSALAMAPPTRPSPSCRNPLPTAAIGSAP